MKDGAIWQGICGFEIETSLVEIPKRSDTDEHCQELVHNCPHAIPNNEFGGLWLKNGGRFYTEPVGRHPEIASPECNWDPYEITAHFLAAIQILRDSAATLSLSRKKRTLIFLNNESSGEPEDSNKSWGKHENYFVPLTTLSSIDDWGSELLPFLATRPVFSGSGVLREHAFELSQRAKHINRHTDTTTTSTKPIFNTRTESLTSDKDFSRIHITFDDTPVIEFQTWLTFGVTMMVISAINMGLLSPWIRTVTLLDPVRTLRLISHDLRFNRLFQTVDGYRATAIDIQKIYLEVVGEMLSAAKSEETPDWMPLVWREWENVLSLLSKKPLPLEELACSVGWANKLLFLRNFFGKSESLCLNEKAKKAEVMYHEITSPVEAIERIKKLSRKVVSPEDVIKAITTPPQTRAANRVKIIKNHGGVADTNWTSVRCDTKTITLDLPFLDSSLPH